MYTEVVNLRDYDPEDKLTDEVSKLVLFYDSASYRLLKSFDVLDKTRPSECVHCVDIHRRRSSRRFEVVLQVRLRISNRLSSQQVSTQGFELRGCCSWQLALRQPILSGNDVATCCHSRVVLESLRNLCLFLTGWQATGQLFKSTRGSVGL